MEFAYDHIQEETLPDAKEDGTTTPTQETTQSTGAHNRQQSLSSEIDQAYRTISASPWGLKFGAIFEQVKKQGEVYYDATKQEYNARSEQAVKGLADLKEQVVTRSRALSTEQVPEGVEEGKTDEKSADAGEGSSTSPSSTGKKNPLQQWLSSTFADGSPKSAAQMLADQNIVKELRAKAMKGITDLQKAEDAADEYLAQLGTNLGNFLKEAITIGPPDQSGEEATNGEKEVMFEAKGSEESKRPIHMTRLDAQLHLLHTNLDNFQTDPQDARYAKDWASSFSAEKRTEQIAKDLHTYPELRSSMEKLVPDTVQYEEFWKRYYFLRSQLDEEEQKRKALLKVAANEEEEVGWDEDSGDEDNTPSRATPKTTTKPAATTESTQDDDDDEEDEDEDDDEEEEEEEEDDDDDEDDEEEDDESEEEEKPVSKSATTAAKNISTPQKSSSLSVNRSKPKATDVTSQPDSEASYDVVSGAPSGAPSNSGGSPPKGKPKDESEDEEDWE